MNALQAVAAAWSIGVPAQVIEQTLASCAAPPGRLEPVTRPTDPFAVLVDYAHTDDALLNVLTALRPLVGPGGRLVTKVAMTRVSFRRLSSDEIAAYVACGEWQGKAGGYAIQGRAEIFVKAIDGAYSTVVGLPLGMTVGLLEGLGWRPENTDG